MTCLLSEGGRVTLASTRHVTRMPFLTLLSLRSSSAGTQGTPHTTISSKALLMSTFTPFGMMSVQQLLDKVLYAFFQDFTHFITFRTPALCSAKLKLFKSCLCPTHL